MLHRMRPSRATRFAAVAIALSGSPALAQFGGFEWTLSGNPDGVGTLSPTTMTVTSPNSAPCAGGESVTYYGTVAPVDGTVSAFLGWVNQDLSPEWDGPVYVVNGVASYIHCDTYACPNLAGAFWFHVDAGDAFGLGALAEDCAYGPGTATFTQFTFTPDAARLDLATWRLIPGSSPGPISGLDRAGDVDGDGVDDLVVGALSGLSPSGQATGEVRVISGLDGSVLAVSHGAMAGDQYGSSVSGAGDVDGDGRADYGNRHAKHAGFGA